MREEHDVNKKSILFNRLLAPGAKRDAPTISPRDLVPNIFLLDVYRALADIQLLDSSTSKDTYEQVFPLANIEERPGKTDASQASVLR